MTRKKKQASVLEEHFYFTVDDWCHTYHYGVNRMRKDRLFPHRINEFNSIHIIGRLRNATRRKIETGELHLSCMDDVTDTLSDDAESVGYTTVKGRHLQCHALIPLIQFHSFPATLTAGKITEFHVTVRNLRHNSGDTDSFTLHRHLSNLQEAGETERELAKTSASFLDL